MGRWAIYPARTFMLWNNNVKADYGRAVGRSRVHVSGEAMGRITFRGSPYTNNSWFL